jgi:hypothetical protein
MFLPFFNTRLICCSELKQVANLFSYHSLIKKKKKERKRVSKNEQTRLGEESKFTATQIG